MQKSKNKVNEYVNLDILKRLNYIYKSIISEDITLEYSKKITKLINNYKKILPEIEKREAWSENTILLITYADSVSKGVSGKSINDFGKFYKKYLEKFIHKKVEKVIQEFGEPTQYLPPDPESGGGKLIYNTKKLGIKCIRTFEVDESERVVGFSSKGCFWLVGKTPTSKVELI